MAYPDQEDTSADCRVELLKLRAQNSDLSESLDTLRRLLDDSSDPIFCFYPDGTYKYVNRAFATGVGLTQDFIIGKTIWDVFPRDEADKRFAAVKWVCENAETKNIEVRVPAPEGDHYYLTTVKPVTGEKGEVTGVMCISKEITERKRAEIEREELIAALKKALSEITQLSGLLPICASCKNIRNDAGYWEQVENYIKKFTGVEFSHSICPDCMEKLYPQYNKKK